MSDLFGFKGSQVIERLHDIASEHNIECEGAACRAVVHARDVTMTTLSRLYLTNHVLTPVVRVPMEGRSRKCTHEGNLSYGDRLVMHTHI